MDSRLASSTAYGSHSAANMSPADSQIFTPLSGAGLCDAVTMQPVVLPSFAARRYAKTPQRRKTWSIAP